MDWGIAWQLAACVTTFIAMWQMGNKRLIGPAWGLVSQVAWFAMIATNAVWGLLPITVAMTFIHARNLRKWHREAS